MRSGKIVSVMSQETRRKANRAVCPYCGGSVKHEADWPDSRIYRCVSCGATVHSVS